MKNLVLFLVIALLIFGAVGYSVISSPDYVRQKMFEQALKGFALNAKSLQNEYKTGQSMGERASKFEIEFQIILGEPVRETLKMEVSSQQVTLRIPNSSQVLAGQTIILEPSLTAGILRWKCINGDVLARVRTKNCRVGDGETLESMLLL